MKNDTICSKDDFSSGENEYSLAKRLMVLDRGENQKRFSLSRRESL
jgi:hypothetical protein